jgi:hypothetical protein
VKQRGDVAVALANAVRALFEEAHSRMAAERRWVLNEKGLVPEAGLSEEIDLLLAARTVDELGTAIGELVRRLGIA